MRKSAAAILFAVLATACGGGGGGTATISGGDGTPKQGGTLNVALESELRTLDPMASTQLVEREVYYNMYDSLVAIDTKLNIIPALATKWETPDPKTYVFTLRSGVKFHDGSDFNADVVKFNIERDINTKTSFRRGELANVDSVEVKDPQTAIIHLKKPDSTLLSALVDRAGMMVSPKAVAAAGAEFTRAPVGAGTGPFQFVEWKNGDHLTLKKNPAYWQKGKPYLDTIIFKPITNTDSSLASLKTGDLDVVRVLSAKDVAGVKADSTLTYRELPGLNFNGFEMNETAAPFNDPKKRQAVLTALDRQQFIKNVNFGIGVESFGPIPPSSWAFDGSEKLYEKADAAKAKALATGFSFSYKTTNNPDNIQGAQLIKSQLEKAGITVNIQVEEFGQILNEAEASPPKFEAAGISWSGRIDPDGNMYSWFHTDAPNNDGKYSNPAVDKLLEDARVQTDQAKRRADYQQAQKQIQTDAVYAFIYHSPAIQATTNKVKGFTLYPDGMFRFAGTWKS